MANVTEFYEMFIGLIYNRELTVDAFGHFLLLFINGFVIRYYQMNSQTTRGEIAVFKLYFILYICDIFFIIFNKFTKKYHL